MRIAATIQNLFGFSLELTRNPQPGDIVKFKSRIVTNYPVPQGNLLVLEVLGRKDRAMSLRLLKADGGVLVESADSFEIVQRKQP